MIINNNKNNQYNSGWMAHFVFISWERGGGDIQGIFHKLGHLLKPVFFETKIWRKEGGKFEIFLLRSLKVENTEQIQLKH